MGNSGGDECNKLAETHTECSQTFLWIYQIDWQKSLLARYGNNISMIDATYKMTWHCFFVCARTNVGYIVVGQFITQSETAEQIQEALQILQTWNPEWKPRYFMCDYSEAELAALEAVFPGVTVYLCDFHREQALLEIRTPELSDVRDIQSIQRLPTLLPLWKTTKCDPALLVENEQGKVPASTNCAYGYNPRHV